MVVHIENYVTYYVGVGLHYASCVWKTTSHWNNLYLTFSLIRIVTVEKRGLFNYFIYITCHKSEISTNFSIVWV